jgi:O-antigen/teichoic acid export membrane protein
VAASRLGRTFAALVGSQLIARVVRLAYVFVIARFIAPDAMGVYQYAFAFYLSLGVFAELGQGARLSAQAASAEDLPGQLAASRVLVLLATGLAAAGGALYVVLELPCGIAEPALVCLVALVARTYAFWVRNCFIAVEDASWIPRYELVFRVTEVGAGIAALALGGGVLALCSVHSVLWIVEAAFSHRRLTARFGALPAVRGGPRALVQLARESFVFLVSSTVMPLYWQISLVILTAVLGEMHSVGQLGIAMQLLAVVATVPMMLGMALVPAVARVRLGGGRELRALQTVIKLALLAGGVIAPLIAATAPWALELLVGPSYREAGHCMAVIAWALAPYAAAQLAMSALNGLGHHRTAALIAVVVVGVHLAAIPLLWSAGPLVAVEWSLVIGAGVGSAIGLWALGIVLEPRGHLWWLGPAALVAAAGVWLHLDLVPGAHAIASAGIVVVAFALGMLRRDELGFIAARLGRPSTDPNRVP